MNENRSAHAADILSEEDARAFAYKWAGERQLDVARFCEYAENVFAEHGPIPTQMLITSMQHFSIESSSTADYWQSFALRAWRESSLWSIETVKHLAMINTAGLAGTLTLLNGGPTIGHDSLRQASAFFIIGLLFALVCFWATTHGYGSRGQQAEERALAIRRSVSWKQYSDASAHPLPERTERRWHMTANFASWGSVLACAYAGFLLIQVLWR